MTEMDEAALAAAKAAGITSPAGISDTHQASREELHQRVIALEGLVRYLFQTYFRSVDPDEIIVNHLDAIKTARDIDDME